MGFGHSIVITGLRSLLQKLASLRSAQQRAVRRRAMMVASKPVLDTAKNLVNVETGLLKRSLGRRVRSYRSGSVVTIIIGPRSGFKQEVKRKHGYVLANPTRYAHFSEFGTVHSQGTHWLERTEELTRDKFVSDLGSEIRAGVERVFSGS